MPIVKEYGDAQDNLVRACADALALAMGASILAILGQDERGVFILPLPGIAVRALDYLASVDWVALRTEASEFYVEK